MRRRATNRHQRRLERTLGYAALVFTGAESEHMAPCLGLRGVKRSSRICEGDMISASCLLSFYLMLWSCLLSLMRASIFLERTR